MNIKGLFSAIFIEKEKTKGFWRKIKDLQEPFTEYLIQEFEKLSLKTFKRINGKKKTI